MLAVNFEFAIDLSFGKWSKFTLKGASSKKLRYFGRDISSLKYAKSLYFESILLVPLKILKF